MRWFPCELDFHWFLVDQWGFEVFEPRIHVRHIRLPLLPSLRLTLGILAGNVLVTRLQTDKHTIIYFVRPSFQSRKLLSLLNEINRIFEPDIDIDTFLEFFCLFVNEEMFYL